MNKRQKFSFVMKVLAGAYALSGLLFFFMPDEVFYMINIGPKVFGLGEEMPLSTERFWLALTASMMAMLVFIALRSSKKPEQTDLILVHLLSKGMSTLGFIYFFVRHKPFFGYVVGAVTDGSIFFVVLYCATKFRFLGEKTTSTNVSR